MDKLDIMACLDVGSIVDCEDVTSQGGPIITPLCASPSTTIVLGVITMTSTFMSFRLYLNSCILGIWIVFLVVRLTLSLDWLGRRLGYVSPVSS